MTKRTGNYPRPALSITLFEVKKKILLQIVLVSLDHFLDHLAAHGASLTGSQITVVALLQVDANLP